MENTFIEKLDENGVTHYVNPKFEKIHDGVEEPELGEEPTVVFTEEELAEAIRNSEKAKAKKYLADTDWYISRKTETGTPIPEEILTKRASARETASN